MNTHFPRKFNLSQGVLQLQFLVTLIVVTLLIFGSWGVSHTFAAPGVLYVDNATGTDTGNCQTPATPCKSISYAITQAVDTDVIQVAQGTYVENLVINKSIEIMGGFEAAGWTRNIALYVTTLDGNSSGTVVDFQAGSDNAILDGFTVTKGSALVGGMGGGITMNDVSPTVKHTTVINNQTTVDGGGIYISGGAPSLEELLIDGNSSVGCCGGVHIGNGAQVNITATTLSNNSASYGGGIGVFSDSTLTITGSTFQANDTDVDGGQGGGMHVSGSGTTVNLTDTILADNLTRDHGAAISADGGTTNLTNALIFGNQSSSLNANVFAISSAAFNVMNSTIVDNQPGGAQAVILFTGGSLTMTNSIMYNNALSLQADPACPSCFTITYTNIQGGWPGTGNIDKDPMFVDSTIHDYHLKALSPGWNTGTPSGAPSADLEGTPRDAVPDMGAYEWVGEVIYLPLELNNFGP